MAFIYRAELHHRASDGIDTAGLGELILANTAGALDTIKMKFVNASPSSELRHVRRSAFGGAMQPNAAFSEPKTITVGSKMNDDSGRRPFD